MMAGEIVGDSPILVLNMTYQKLIGKIGKTICTDKVLKNLTQRKVKKEIENTKSLGNAPATYLSRLNRALPSERYLHRIVIEK